ncbi:hypothetical protein ACIQCF_33210 [Streptomyces sp. NPDC088353]
MTAEVGADEFLSDWQLHQSPAEGLGRAWDGQCIFRKQAQALR